MPSSPRSTTFTRRRYSTSSAASPSSTSRKKRQRSANAIEELCVMTRLVIAYLDCYSGISGDMTLGALLDAGLDAGELRAALASLPVGGYELRAEPVVSRGI